MVAADLPERSTKAERPFLSLEDVFQWNILCITHCFCNGPHFLKTIAPSLVSKMRLRPLCHRVEMSEPGIDAAVCKRVQEAFLFTSCLLRTELCLPVIDRTPADTLLEGHQPSDLYHAALQ